MDEQTFLQKFWSVLDFKIYNIYFLVPYINKYWNFALSIIFKTNCLPCYDTSCAEARPKSLILIQQQQLLIWGQLYTLDKLDWVGYMNSQYPVYFIWVMLSLVSLIDMSLFFILLITSTNVIFGFPSHFFHSSTWINSLGSLLTLLWTWLNHLKRFTLIFSSIGAIPIPYLWNDFLISSLIFLCVLIYSS